MDAICPAEKDKSLLNIKRQKITKMALTSIVAKSIIHNIKIVAPLFCASENKLASTKKSSTVVCM